MSAEIESKIGNGKGNSLSDQPEAVRQQMIGQLRELLGSRELSAPSTPGASPVSSTGHDGQALQRWLMDPRVGPALVKLLDAIAQAIAPTAKDAPPAASNVLSRGEMKRRYEMAPGHVEYFPTWSFWGRTFVRMDNIGSVPTVVTINEERFHLNPGEGTTKDGLWAAFPIRVVNTSELPGSLVAVTVT